MTLFKNKKEKEYAKNLSEKYRLVWSDIKIAKSNLICSGCEKHIYKGSRCVVDYFDKYTDEVYCLNCALVYLIPLMENDKRIVDKIIKNKELWDKEEMACALAYGGQK